MLLQFGYLIDKTGRMTESVYFNRMLGGVNEILNTVLAQTQHSINAVIPMVPLSSPTTAAPPRLLTLGSKRRVPFRTV